MRYLLIFFMVHCNTPSTHKPHKNVTHNGYKHTYKSNTLWQEGTFSGALGSHTTHNNKMSRRRPTPSNFALYIHGEGNSAPKSWHHDSPWVHSKCLGASLQSLQLVPLFGATKHNPLNNRERDWVLALGGRRLDVKRNNQPKVGISGGGDIIEEPRPWQNLWGGAVSLFGGGKLCQQNQKIKYVVALGGPQTRITN